MKLILQIALGVFLGTLAAQFAVFYWQDYRESLAKTAAEKIANQQEQIRNEQAERIRNLILQSRDSRKPPLKPPAGFVPDDAQEPQQ